MADDAVCQSISWISPACQVKQKNSFKRRTRTSVTRCSSQDQPDSLATDSWPIPQNISCMNLQLRSVHTNIHSPAHKHLFGNPVHCACMCPRSQRQNCPHPQQFLAHAHTCTHTTPTWAHDVHGMLKACLPRCSQVSINSVKRTCRLNCIR